MEERRPSLGLTNRFHRSRSAEDALKGIDLNRNIEALIENPLSHLTPEQLQHDVRSFARTTGLEQHQDLLDKGARIAKDPRYFEAIAGVTEDEKQALRDERTRRFRQPPALYLTIIICSVGAAVQGWDQTGLNGANLKWPRALGLNTDKRSNDFWILGLVNAAPYLAAALIGCWLSHPLNHRLGRRGTIFVAAWFCFLSVIGSAFTQTWVQLFICRLLLGIGMGAKASTIPVLAAENSPASIRGSLVMGWQLWVAFESPRWYIKKHRYHEAFRSLQRLRNTPLQAARDLYYIQAQVRLEEMMLGDGDIIMSEGKEHYSSSGRYASRFIQLFTIARIRRATLASFVVMIAQQMCGINIMAFYSTTLFVDAKASERSALLVSWGFGLINFAFAWPAVRSIDHFGRRNLLLFTFPHMAWTLLASGFSFYVPNSSPAHLGLITLFIFLFAAFYSPGEGPVPFTYSAEAFPLFHREVGMSLAVSINLFFAAVLTIVFPKMSDALTPTGAIGFFAGLNIIAFFMIFLWVPETKQRTLEELDYIFAVPTRKHMHYQITKVIPYTFRRHILRRNIELEPLYKFQRGNLFYRYNGIRGVSYVCDIGWGRSSADLYAGHRLLGASTSSRLDPSLSFAARLDASLRSLLRPSRRRIAMQSPAASHRLKVLQLCASIWEIIEEFANLCRGSAQSDIEAIRLEVQTLHRYLELIEKVQSAEAQLSELEKSHLQDVDQLLHRCHRTLITFHHSLAVVRAQTSKRTDEEEPWDFQGLTYRAPRVHISFYTRTLEMSFRGITLAHRWKALPLHHRKKFDWGELTMATQALQKSVMQRKRFTGTGDQEESVEERGLLRDTESCIRSANDIISLSGTTANGDDQSSVSSIQHVTDAPMGHWINEILPWTAQLPVGNGSSVAPSHSDSRTDDQPSDDSEGESIVDPEPDLEAGFTPEVYATIITNLQYGLQKEMDAREYRHAEGTYRAIVKHCIDRETNHGIMFENRSQLNETLAEIYLHTRRYQKAKRILGQLLKEETANIDRKWRLYGSLAMAYRGQKQLDKALLNAKRSLRGRVEMYPQDHCLVYESAALVIDIYERQGDYQTAKELRGIYCPDTLPPPPPKSALRNTFRRTTQSPPPPLRHSPQSAQNQPPPGYQEENNHHSESHVRWAADVWVNDSGINKIHDTGRTRLIDTIHIGDEDYVKILLDKRANVETPCVDTISPLMHAVTQGHPGIVKLLLERGAQVNALTSRWSPLHRATEDGDLATMRLLLAHGADIEYKSPLEYVPPRSEMAKLKAIANDEPDPEADIALEPGQGWSPLLRAASKGDEPAVRLLLDHNANIETRNPHKATPLMCACENLHLSTVDLLLMRGANVHAFDKYGWHPIHRALVNSGNPKTPNTIVPRLLDSEADINARCDYNKTPLHYAVEKADAPMVAFLLEKYADIEARDKADLTPLHTAIQCRHVSMVRLLLEQGADATAMDAAGEDALAAARNAERKSPEIIEVLREHKK
ncbi:MAG: hypothetical protein Q9218_005336, partial [Villophora microphyllina]